MSSGQIFMVVKAKYGKMILLSGHTVVLSMANDLSYCCFHKSFQSKAKHTGEHHHQALRWVLQMVTNRWDKCLTTMTWEERISVQLIKVLWRIRTSQICQLKLDLLRWIFPCKMEVEASMNNLVESGHKFEPLNAKAVELDNLYPALVECFGIIFLGYMAGRLYAFNMKSYFVQIVYTFKGPCQHSVHLFQG